MLLRCVKTFYILIFFSDSETTGPIGTKFDEKFHWMVPYKFMPFFYWSEVHKGNKRTKGLKKGVSIYRYKLFIVPLCLTRIFINAFLKKIPFSNMHDIIM